jgi:probable addiction module antidote protein
MTKIKKAAISYRDDLIETLKDDEQSQLAFIQASFEENSDMPSAILSAIRIVAEARGFKNFAESAKLNRENLYRVLTETGNPRLDTFLKILKALELKLSVEPKKKVS